MDLKELFDFTKSEHERLVTHHKVRDNPKTKYAMMTKLVEEMGELAEAMLTNDSLQREDKLQKARSELSDEFADVLLATLILAEEWNIDLHKALTDKINKIEKRSYS